MSTYLLATVVKHVAATANVQGVQPESYQMVHP